MLPKKYAPRGVSIWRCRITNIRIPIIEIRQSHDCLIFIRGISYRKRRYLYWDGAWFAHCFIIVWIMRCLQNSIKITALVLRQSYYRIAAAKSRRIGVDRLNKMNSIIWLQQTNPDNKDYGANMGPTWVLSSPGGPHAGPMKPAIWQVKENHAQCYGALLVHGQIDTDSNHSLTCNTNLLSYGWQNGVGKYIVNVWQTKREQCYSLFMK